MARGPTRKAPRRLLREIRVVKRDLVKARVERKSCGFFEKLRILEADKRIASLEERLVKLQEKACGQRKPDGAG